MRILVQGNQVFVRANAAAYEPGRPVLVFVHGAGGSGAHWLTQYEALKERFSLVIPDLPGHGASAGAPVATVAGLAGWLRELLAGMRPGPRLEDVVVVGHSLGGAVALEYALAGHPLRGLGLISTGARLRVSPLVFEALRQAGPETWADAALGMFYGSNLPPPVLAAARDELLATPRETCLADFAAADAWDAMARVSAIGVPTLIAGGDADAATPVKYARFLAEQITGAALHVGPGVGHMPMLESPAWLAALLADFAGRLAGEPSGARPAP